MATKIFKRNKVILTSPLISKTIFPFAINYSIASGGPYKLIGRIIRPVEQNTQLDMNIIFQTRISDSPFKSNLKIKYEAVLVGGTSVDENMYEDVLEVGQNGGTYQIFFSNTLDNNSVLISAYATNETAILNNSFANIIDLIYLEKKEV